MAKFGWMLLALCWPELTQAGRRLRVTQETTPLLSAPGGGTTVLNLASGTELEEQGRKGMFWQVRTEDGRAGFVSLMAVRPAPVDETGIGEALRQAVQQGRSSNDATNVRARSAVMGVRGLDASSDVAYAGNIKPNPRMVVQMEALVISAEELAAIERGVYSEVQQRLDAKKRQTSEHGRPPG